MKHMHRHGVNELEAGAELLRTIAELQFSPSFCFFERGVWIGDSAQHMFMPVRPWQ